jgi:hypothetical protein
MDWNLSEPVVLTRVATAWSIQDKNLLEPRRAILQDVSGLWAHYKPSFCSFVVVYI